MELLYCVETSIEARGGNHVVVVGQWWVIESFGVATGLLHGPSATKKVILDGKRHEDVNNKSCYNPAGQRPQRVSSRRGRKAYEANLSK
jgi:hypothetical protein